MCVVILTNFSLPAKPVDILKKQKKAPKTQNIMAPFVPKYYMISYFFRW